jgi:hypothetical protein
MLDVYKLHESVINQNSNKMEWEKTFQKYRLKVFPN